MSNKVKLLAVTHRNEPGLPSRLIDDYGNKFFSEHILPDISDQTILVAEGAYMSKIHAYTHPMYRTSLRDICPSLADSNKKPRIIYNDYLLQLPSAKVKSKLQQIQMFQAICLDYIGLDVKLIPKDFADFADVLRRDDLFIVRRPVPESVKGLASVAMNMNDKRNLAFAQAVERAQKLSDDVLFISGISHALDLHMKYGWPIEFLIEKSGRQSGISDLFLAVLIANRIPAALVSHIT